MSDCQSLLGVADVRITDKHELNFQINKVGGSPNFYPHHHVESPMCSACDTKLCLVVQLYCPLESTNFHRTLYIFACPEPSCWNLADRWKVFRCQTEVKTPQQAVTAAPKTFVDDWGENCDDWGSGDEDWGTSNDESDKNAVDNSWSGSHPTAADKNSCGANDWTISTEKTGIVMNPQESKERNNTNTGVDILPLETMCSDDVEDEEESEELKHIISEDVNIVTDEQKLHFFGADKQSSSVSGCQSADLESYFINVFDESDLDSDKDVHVTRLLKEYEHREGQSLKDVSMDTRSSAGGDTERYEKTNLRHGDLFIHRFMKHIAVCPEQCVRYSWAGSPLFIRKPSTQVFSKCRHCNGDLVFELQLMPALVNLLKFPKHKDPAVEFGTVLIFTCKTSCWASGDNYRTEYVVVQSDPDHDRFK